MLILCRQYKNKRWNSVHIPKSVHFLKTIFQNHYSFVFWQNYCSVRLLLNWERWRTIIFLFANRSVSALSQHHLEGLIAQIPRTNDRYKSQNSHSDQNSYYTCELFGEENRFRLGLASHMNMFAVHWWLANIFWVLSLSSFL